MYPKNGEPKYNEKYLKYGISKGMTYTMKCVNMLSLKAESSIVADDILNYSYYFSEKIWLDTSCELSCSMKCQFLFSLNNNNNNK